MFTGKLYAYDVTAAREPSENETLLRRRGNTAARPKPLVYGSNRHLQRLDSAHIMKKNISTLLLQNTQTKLITRRTWRSIKLILFHETNH